MSQIQFIEPSPAATVEFIAAHTGIPANGSDNTFSLASIGIGSAAKRRRVFLHLGWTSGNGSDCPVQATSTINGEACTVHVQHYHSSVSFQTALISARVDAGSSVTVNIDYQAGGNNYFMGMAVYKVMNLRSPIAFHTANDEAGPGATTKSLSLNVKNDGIALFGSYFNSASGFGLTGITERYEDALSGTQKIIGGDLAVTADETGRVLTMARNSGAATFSGSLVAASFR